MCPLGFGGVLYTLLTLSQCGSSSTTLHFSVSFFNNVNNIIAALHQKVLFSGAFSPLSSTLLFRSLLPVVILFVWKELHIALLTTLSWQHLLWIYVLDRGSKTAPRCSALTAKSYCQWMKLRSTKHYAVVDHLHLQIRSFLLMWTC